MAMSPSNGLLQNFNCARPWVGMVANQGIAFCGAGICDPWLQNSVSALEPWRFDTGLIAIQSAITTVPTSGAPGPTAVNTDGNNLQIPGGASLTLFQNGVGDPMQISDGSAWWTATTADKDLLREGAPMDEPFYFIVTGFCWEVPEVIQRGGTFTASTDPVVFAPWLTDQSNGSQYTGRIQRSILNNLAINITYGDSGCSYRLGVAAFFPTFGSPRGGTTITNGNNTTPLVYTPLMIGVAIGPRDDSRQVSLTCTFGQSAIIQSDPTNPTISGTTIPGVINSTNVGTVFAKVRVLAIGYPVCMPREDCYPFNGMGGGFQGMPQGGQQQGMPQGMPQGAQQPVANSQVAAAPSGFVYGR
jgi:hypothetical protein